jgi:hypothetical protein
VSTGAWLPAGRFLGSRLRAFFDNGGQPPDAGSVESNILIDLKCGRLQARGRRLTLEPLPPASADPLIPGDVRPVVHHVEPIPESFWDDLIWHSGREGHTEAAFDCCRFRCGDEVWSDVEIFAAARNVGGRRPTYAWADFEAKALERLEDEGGFGPEWTQSALEREMAAWCLHQWGKEPAESLIRAHVKRAVKGFRDSRRKA